MKKCSYYLSVFTLLVLISSSLKSECYTLYINKEKSNFTKYPYYKEVVDYFFDNYSVSEFSDYKISFKKHSKGYSAVVSKYDNEWDVVDEFLLWDANERKFQKLKLQKLDDLELNKDLKKTYITEGEIDKYDCCPYYGYAQWTHDVIEDFQDFESLTDTLLYGVSRAYFDHAEGLLWRKETFSYDHQYQFDDSTHIMNDVQYNKYLKYVRKSEELLTLVSHLILSDKFTDIY